MKIRYQEGDDEDKRSKWQKLQDKKSKWEKLQDGDWKSSLRITGTDAPARQLMSEAGRMRLEARKLRHAGDMKGYYELMRMAAAEKIAGEPTVKSQAFVDAAEEAKRRPSPTIKIMDKVAAFLDERPELPKPPSMGGKRKFEDADLPTMRPSIFAPWEYKEDALAIINDPTHPRHDPSTVASLKKKWNIE
jgi:hypothetical protein